MKTTRTQQLLETYSPGGSKGKTCTFISIGDVQQWSDGRCTLDMVYLPKRNTIRTVELSKEENEGFSQLGDSTGHYVTLEYRDGGVHWTKGSLSRINKLNVKQFTNRTRS